MMQRLAGITIWAIQGIWFTNQPNPNTAIVALWVIMVLLGAGLIFGPRITNQDA